MIKVKRDNVIYSISEEEKGEYLKKGYSLLDSNGKEIKTKKKNNDKEIETLLKQVNELTATIETLTDEKASLEAEKASLTATIKTLTSEVEQLKKNGKE